jgi:cold shock CspA family protein
MQGTVKDYDDRTRAGALLTDEHAEVQIDPVSTQGSEIRVLRIGQRVKFELVELEGVPVARHLHIVTFD